MTLHKVYEDEQAVAALTREHIAAGRTVLQMFQLADTERNHSLRVLEMLQLPESATVLSLGCGVAGMEAYWYDERPEFSFELVNLSQAQLDLCVLPGQVRVWADATHYRSKHVPFDVTVLAYVLGHLDVPVALVTAKANTRAGGLVLVLDAFDGTRRFDQFFHYDSPRSDDLRDAGFVEQPTAHPWRLMPFIHLDSPWVPRHVTPQAWTCHV